MLIRGPALLQGKCPFEPFTNSHLRFTACQHKKGFPFSQSSRGRLKCCLQQDYLREEEGNESWKAAGLALLKHPNQTHGAGSVSGVSPGTGRSVAGVIKHIFGSAHQTRNSSWVRVEMPITVVSLHGFRCIFTSTQG